MAQPDTSSQHLPVGVKQLYKCLLNQHAQKIWKQLPVYQTLNEGSDHSPKFRCTVWVDGVGYTSPNTFNQRKMAEMDASRVAFFGTLQKLKNEASRLVLEDQSFCKSALVEYATRMNIQKPTYQTMQLETRVPVFCSSLVVDGVSCTGENGRSKKEAEQSAARAAVLKYLDSESGGHIMSEIINCRFKRYTEMKELQSAHSDTNKIVPTGGENALTLNKTKVEEGTKMPSPTGVKNGFTLNETKVEEGTKMPSPTSVENALTLNETKVEEGTKMPSPTGVENGLTLNETKIEEETKVPSIDICSIKDATIPATHSYVNLPQSHTQKVSTQALTPAIPVPTVLPKSPFAGTHYVPNSSVKSAPSIVVNPPPPNVVQVAKSEESSVTVATPLSLSSPAKVQTTFASPTCGKKRNHNNRKMAQKKMRVENQSPIPLSQAPTSSAR